jgi:hypothetical protein
MEFTILLLPLTLLETRLANSVSNQQIINLQFSFTATHFVLIKKTVNTDIKRSAIVRN